MNINIFVINVIINVILLVNEIYILKLNYIKQVKEKQEPIKKKLENVINVII